MTSRVRSFLIGPLMPLSLLAFVFFLTVIFYSVFRPNVDGRIFFYPDNAGIRTGAERRGVPGRRDIEEKITVFLEELFIGPVDLHLSRTVPEKTATRDVSVIDRTVYINFDERMLNSYAELSISTDEALENIRYNIHFNFPRIEEVVFLINGSQVHAPYYSENVSTN